MKRYTKIICTLGPASTEKAMLQKMIARGMDVARLNFSHSPHEEILKRINMVREINKANNFRVRFLADLEGYRIRVGHFDKPIELKKDAIFFVGNQERVTANSFSFDFSGDITAIKKGYDVFIDDGNLHLQVVGNDKKRLKLKVIQGGVLKQRKGINIPDQKLESNILTAKDKHDIEFINKNKFDCIAQSFVRNKQDIARVVDMVKPRLPMSRVIAKIENREGVANVDTILDACDGIMIARGDLGVSMPIYKIPMLQKYLIRHAIRKKKLVITATQMLESMIENGQPTRAEVADVANAILDGTDFVMLSGETAVGKFPSRCIEMMHKIIVYTEETSYAAPK